MTPIGSTTSDGFRYAARPVGYTGGAASPEAPQADPLARAGTDLAAEASRYVQLRTKAAESLDAAQLALDQATAARKLGQHTKALELETLSKKQHSKGAGLAAMADEEKANQEVARSTAEAQAHADIAGQKAATQARADRDAVPDSFLRDHPEYASLPASPESASQIKKAYWDEQAKGRQVQTAIAKDTAIHDPNVAGSEAFRAGESAKNRAASLERTGLGIASREKIAGEKTTTARDTAEYKKAVAPLDRAIKEAEHAFDAADHAMLSPSMMTDTDAVKKEWDARKLAKEHAVKAKEDFDSTWDAAHAAGASSVKPSDDITAKVKAIEESQLPAAEKLRLLDELEKSGAGSR